MKRNTHSARLKEPGKKSLTMYDTVVLSTEHMAPEDWTAIQDQMQMRSGTSMATGEVEYIHYTLNLVIPQTNCPVRLTIRTAKWMRFPGEKSPRKVDGMRSLRIECSLHRAMLGHNCFGGPTEFQPACKWLIHQLGVLLQVWLPDLPAWRVHRVDVAECFDLGSEEAVRGWIRARTLGYYPRRTLHFWSDLGFSADGTTTCLRAYAKGPEFHESMYGAYLKVASVADAFMVSERARSILRCEVEIKASVLEALESNAIPALSDEYLHGIYDREWDKFTRNKEQDDTLAHTAIDVEMQLRAYAPGALASLYPIWCLLAVRGETFYRTLVSGSTWRRQRRELEAAGIDWMHTDVSSLSADSPVGFIPCRSAQERLTDVSAAVLQALSEDMYRAS